MPLKPARKTCFVLYTGNAGWPGTSERLGDHVGICHAELEAAYNKTPSKVRTIQLPPIEAEPGPPNQRFQTYFKNQKLSGPQVQTGEEAVAWAGKLAVSALLDLARAGVGAGSKGSYYAGEALQRARLDYEHRRKVTTDTVVAYLQGALPRPEDRQVSQHRDHARRRPASCLRL
jgi:hypothetical protein